MPGGGDFSERYDVVVVGAGHAGCEAAVAAARMGARTALFTLNLDLIAQMSCNPAIGGIAKGHLVREVDALGGVMGGVIDETGIQFRLLNTSRGPAVWSPRAQADKKQYRIRMRQVLEAEPRLRIRQAEAVDVLTEPAPGGGRRALGLLLRDGRRIGARAVVVTTGTFLNGLIHVGDTTYPAGRSGEPAAHLLGEALRRLGLPTGRLKTGTPPRLDGRTIDWTKFEPQPGDAEPTPFSFATARLAREQVPCHIGYSTPAMRRLILDNLARSPLYSGQIAGVGPRYCPSFEDKVVKFPDKERHQIFLEPEGLDTHEIYLNGLSTSMPIDVQQAMVAAIPGLERAEMLRPGYAIEYDFVQPTALTAALEVKTIPALFLGGQINGTTGYEEAACQGQLAGINAALLALSGAAAGEGYGEEAGAGARREPPLTLSRTEAYAGILVDDLITRGVDEPYRMFTSRAEFRLHLRMDNADARLTPHGRRLGLIGDERWAAFTAKQRRMTTLADFLAAHRPDPARPEAERFRAWLRGERPTAAQLLRRPELTWRDFLPLFEAHLPGLLREQRAADPAHWEMRGVETDIKFAGYLQQQRRQMEQLRRAERRTIPADFDYRGVPGLSREMREKLARTRPETLGQAGNIPGVTPAAVSLLQVLLERRALAARPARAN